MLQLHSCINDRRKFLAELDNNQAYIQSHCDTLAGNRIVKTGSGYSKSDITLKFWVCGIYDKEYYIFCFYL